ncbi:hypothetical protein AB0B48_31465, partial [Micromonospora sp. NPDC049089]
MREPTAPPVPALPALRRQALRHHLLTEVRRPSRRPRRMRVLVPVAGVLTVVVAAGMVAQPWSSDSAPLIVPVEQGERVGASLLLNRMAAVAAGRRGPPPGEGG